MTGKLKNKMLWVSVISLVALLLVQYGVDDTKFKLVADLILSILVTLGILNNPDSENRL